MFIKTAPTRRQGLDSTQTTLNLLIPEKCPSTQSKSSPHRLRIQVLHKRLRAKPKEGTNLLNFFYDQFYNDKLVLRYKRAPTDVCPLFRCPDSCTDIDGECLAHFGYIINRHITACQLVFATIGGALYNATNLGLVTADVGTRPHTEEIIP